MNIRKTVTLIPTQIEVGCTRRGRPSYRWAPGYWVADPTSNRLLYPPVPRREAYALAREIAPGCRVVIGEAA